MKRRIWTVLLSVIVALSLMQVTAMAEGQSSKGFLPENDIHYLLNTPDGDNSWYVSRDFVITANSGYLLSLGNQDDSSWGPVLSFPEQGANCEIMFYVKNTTSQEISSAVSLYYKKDSTSPVGKIQIKENEFKTFLNTITFGLFLKIRLISRFPPPTN